MNKLLILFFCLLMIPLVSASTLLYNSTEDYITGSPDNDPWLYKCYNSATYYLMTWDTDHYDCDNVPTDQSGYPYTKLVSGSLETHSGTNTADWDNVIEFKSPSTGIFNISYDFLMNPTTGNLNKSFRNSTFHQITSEVMTVGENWKGSFLIQLSIGESIYLHQNRYDGSNAGDQVIKNEILVYSGSQDGYLNVYAKNNFTDLAIQEFNISLYSSSNIFQLYNSTITGAVNVNISYLPNDNYTLYFYSGDYKDMNTTFEFLGDEITYQFLTNKAPSLNISFYDEITQETINNVSYDLIFSDYAVNSNVTTGNFYSELNNSGPLEIVYQNNDYYFRKYFINVTDETTSELSLYLLNESLVNAQEIAYQVTDQDGRILEGAIVKAYRRYIEDDITVFKPVEMSKSDNAGEGILHLEKYGPNYRFLVEYNGNIILVTGDNQIFSNAITLKSDLTTSVITSTVGNSDLRINFSYDETTLSLTTFYNDPSAITDELCVKIEKIGREITLINSSCNSGPSGFIVLGVTNETGQYRVYASQITNTLFDQLVSYSEAKPAGIFSITISDVKEVIGVSGIFYLIMFAVTGALIGLMVFQNAAGTISLTALGFVVGVMFKITEFGWVAGITVVTIAGFLLYVTKQRGVGP